VVFLQHCALYKFTYLHLAWQPFLQYLQKCGFCTFRAIPLWCAASYAVPLTYMTTIDSQWHICYMFFRLICAFNSYLMIIIRVIMMTTQRSIVHKQQQCVLLFSTLCRDHFGVYSGRIWFLTNPDRSRWLHASEAYEVSFKLHTRQFEILSVLLSLLLSIYFLPILYISRHCHGSILWYLLSVSCALCFCLLCCLDRRQLSSFRSYINPFAATWFLVISVLQVPHEVSRCRIQLGYI